MPLFSSGKPTFAKMSDLDECKQKYRDYGEVIGLISMCKTLKEKLR